MQINEGKLHQVTTSW